MTRIILLFCTVTLGLSISPLQFPPTFNNCGQSDTSDLLPPADYGFFHDSTYLDSVIRYRMRFYRIPGSATVVVKNGQIIWQMPFGYAYVQDSILIADSTIFTVMSVSKTMVAWAVMQLWENGSLGLDDNINDHLPFQVVHPLYPDSIITIRMLMAHTAGLRDCMSTFYSMISWGHDSPIPLGEFLPDYFVPGGTYYFADSNFTPYAPGRVSEYCNFAITLLAYIVEYTADSFPVYCRDSIFNPLSMSKSCWFLSELDTMCMAMPYQWNGSSYVPYGHYGWVGYPAGFLRTNTLELVRSLQAFMQHGQIDGVRLLDSTTVEMMTTVQYPAADPNQGLIWYKMMNYGRLLWGHAGGWLGFCTFQFYCPAENTGVIVLTNMDATTLCWTGVCKIADDLFDFAAEYNIAESPAGIGIKAPTYLFPTIFSGPLQLPKGKKCLIFDAAGRKVEPTRMSPGVYFIEVDGTITSKIVKVR